MYTGELIAAGIDYLTCTMENSNPNVVQWYRTCEISLQEVADNGNAIKMAKRLGYDGFSCGGSFIGSRERDTICSIAGADAKHAFAHIYHRGVHFSRIDVQCSYKYDVMSDNIAQQVLDQVIKDNAKIGEARQRDATIIQSLRSGATCYVGSRNSEQFARVYNKEKQSKEEAYKGVWRYEVQLKNDLAQQTADNFIKNDYNQETYAATFVRHWLRHRGIRVPWKAEAELIPLPKIAVKDSDVERKLKWLREQVRPAIAPLLKYGLVDAILDALGLIDNPQGEP